MRFFKKKELKKHEIRFNQRTWLNTLASHYTGSITCFDGTVKNRGQPLREYTFVEIADCHGKVRIHVDDNSGLEEFIEKIDSLIYWLKAFRQHLARRLEEKK